MPSSTSPLIASAMAVLMAAGGAAYVVTVSLRNRKKHPSKEKVIKQRQAHFSKSMSVSYSNSDPLMIMEGRGARLIDENGVSYLDTRNNVGHVGHSHPAVAQAVAKHVSRLNTNTRYLHPNITELAERLLAKMPDTMDQVFFCNSGSEANDLALRLARAWAGGSQNTIVVEGAYHGHTLATLELSPNKYNETASKEEKDNAPFSEEHKFDNQYDNHKGSEFQSPGSHITKVPCPDVYRGLFRDPVTAGAMYAQTVQDACDKYTQQGQKVGAFIMEGALGVGGAILPPSGYLKGCADAVRCAGGLYIADEVQTGFGRLGSCFWAFQYQHSPDEVTVVPDIVTVGKPFGNGMPLAAVVTSRKITSVFEHCGVEYFNTFGGNPVSAAAGLAVLDVLEKEQLQKRALEVGTYLKTQFEALQQQCDWIGDVRGSGLFLGVELVQNTTTREPAANVTSWLSSMLKTQYQILTSIDGLAMNVLVIKPPLAFRRSDADYFVRSVQEVLMEVLPQALKNGELEAVPKTPT